MNNISYGPAGAIRPPCAHSPLTELRIPTCAREILQGKRIFRALNDAKPRRCFSGVFCFTNGFHRCELRGLGSLTPPGSACGIGARGGDKKDWVRLPSAHLGPGWNLAVNQEHAQVEVSLVMKPAAGGMGSRIRMPVHFPAAPRIRLCGRDVRMRYVRRNSDASVKVGTRRPG